MTETLTALATAANQFQAEFSRLEQIQHLDTPRAEGKWSPRFIFHHIADIESLQAVRLLAMLCQDNAIIMPAQQELYASNTHYTTRDPSQSIAAFVALRQRNVQLLSSLSSNQLERKGTHPIRGEFSIAAWAAFMVKHDANHLEQLRAS